MNPLQTNDYSTSLPNSSSSVSYHPYSSLSPNNFNNRFEQPQTTNNYQLTGLPYSFTPYIVSASHNNHYSSPLNYIYPPFLPPAQIDFQRSVSQVYEPPSSLLPAMASSRRSREEVEEENEVVGIEELKKIRKKRRLSSEEPSVEDKKSRIYVCSICEKSFARPSALAIHERSHSKVKPYPCPVKTCQRPFAVVANLKRHQKVFDHYVRENETEEADQAIDGNEVKMEES